MKRSSKALPKMSRKQPALSFQILGVCLMALALLMALSLLSHSPEDPPNSTRPLELAQNLAGWLGAHVSYYLLFGVGYGAYALTVLVFLFGWNRFRISDAKPLVMHSIILLSLIVLFCGAIGVLYWEQSSMAWKLGGWLGFMLSSSLLVPYLGVGGSYICLATLLVVLLMVATDIPFNRIPEWALQGLKGLVGIGTSREGARAEKDGLPKARENKKEIADAPVSVPDFESQPERGELPELPKIVKKTPESKPMPSKPRDRV